MGPPHQEQEIVRNSCELESYRHQPYEVTESLPHSHAKPRYSAYAASTRVCCVCTCKATVHLLSDPWN